MVHELYLYYWYNYFVRNDEYAKTMCETQHFSKIQERVPVHPRAPAQWDSDSDDEEDSLTNESDGSDHPRSEANVRRYPYSCTAVRVTACLNVVGTRGSRSIPILEKC